MHNIKESQVSRRQGRLPRRAFLAGISSAAALTSVGPVRATSARRSDDVIIIGAGLSGLNAARILERQGLQVTVLESRDRIGGRVHTLDDVPGQPEAGGNIIGPMYSRLIDTANRLQLKLIPARTREPSEFSNPADAACLHLNGSAIRLRDWPDHPANPFPEPFREMAPWRFRNAALAAANPLTKLDDWLQPEFAPHDVSIAEALGSAGINRASVDLGITENQGYGNFPEDVSALHIHQTMTWGKHQSQGSGIFAIAGGNQRLPEAMAASLRGRVLLGDAVTGIQDETGRAKGGRVEVHTEAGRTYRAKGVLVTLPFSAARALRIRPLLQGRQAEAVATLNYSSTTQVLCAVERPYWEQDRLPATMWTDKPFGQLLAYPYGTNGKITSAAFWMMGYDALVADRFTDAQLMSRCIAQLAQIRPAAAAALRPLRVVSWQRDPSAAGTWASWGPGQISRFANVLARPSGRIHFAGEHTARLERGMEAAMESGERAAVELLERLL